MDRTSIILHWIAYFFEAKLRRPRPGRGRNFGQSRPVCPRRLNTTGYRALLRGPSHCL